MTLCPYPYCDARFTAGSDCPVCGHPADAPSLRTKPFFAGQLPALLERLPARWLDMHQILPAHPRIEQYQPMVMKLLGIERALLQSVPAQAASLHGNASLAAIAARHPGTFWTSWFIDPMARDAVQQVEDAVRHGVRVVKLIPATGWCADDDRFWPFWSLLQEKGLVAMVHTGFITARHREEEVRAGHFLRSGLGDPLHFDRVCRAFPDLAVILCHLGGSIYTAQAAEMTRQHANVWGDVSGSGRFALRNLLHQRIPFDPSKLFWGNDSAPFAYPLNLRLLFHDLDTYGATDLIEPLLRDNGQRFADRWLG